MAGTPAVAWAASSCGVTACNTFITLADNHFRQQYRLTGRAKQQLMEHAADLWHTAQTVTTVVPAKLWLTSCASPRLTTVHCLALTRRPDCTLSAKADGSARQPQTCTTTACIESATETGI